MIFSYLKRPDAARADFLMAHELLPANIDVCDELGTLFRSAKEFSEAIEWHTKALELAKNLPSGGETSSEETNRIQIANAYFHLGRVYHEMGNTAKAAAMLIEARKSGLSYQDY